MLSCQRCKQTTNGPQAFLLTCQGCNKTWHHGCHMPPMEEPDLILRLRATKSGDIANSLSAWRCRRCKKNKESATGTTPSVFSSVEPEKSVSSAASVQTKSEDDDRMEVDPSPQAPGRVSTPNSGIQPMQAPSSVNQAIRPRSIANEPAPVVIQPQDNQDVADDGDDDDSEDLYGPPVERRVIRILPSLAEELREQQRARHALLAPDWILERHANDPSWNKDTLQTAVGRRRARKPQAKKIGENGINVDQLMGYFTIHDWMKKHAA